VAKTGGQKWVTLGTSLYLYNGQKWGTCVHLYGFQKWAPHPYISLYLSGGEKWGTSIYLPDDQKYGNSIHLSAGQKWSSERCREVPHFELQISVHIEEAYF